MIEPTTRLIELMASYVGTTEVGGNNMGPVVEEFQKSCGCVPQGQPWCMAFLQYGVERVEAELGVQSPIYKSQSVLEVWNKTPKMCRLDHPVVGSFMIWQHFNAAGLPTANGHAEIVSSILDANTIETIGGNTSGGPGIDRNGDGVYRKIRSLTGSNELRVKGWLMVWV